jgi:hypothetical protein
MKNIPTKLDRYEHTPYCELCPGCLGKLVGASLSSFPWFKQSLKKETKEARVSSPILENAPSMLFNFCKVKVIEGSKSDRSKIGSVLK